MAELESGARESFFTNADGKRIFCRYWCEDMKDPKYVVFLAFSFFLPFLICFGLLYFFVTY